VLTVGTAATLTLVWAIVTTWVPRIVPTVETAERVCVGASHTTCAEIAGAKVPDNAGEDSISILPHLLGTSKFFHDPVNYDFYTGVFESYDGGVSWTELQPAGVENYSLTSDPVTTFDDQGNGYFTLLTRGPTGVDMLKKPAGSNWLPPVVVTVTAAERTVMSPLART
jgi:hypothetical protein